MAHACGTYGCKEDAVSPHTAHLSGCSCRRTNCSTPNYLSSPGLPLNRLLCLAIGEQESPIPGSSLTVIVPEKIRAPQFELCRVEPLFLESRVIRHVLCLISYSIQLIAPAAPGSYSSRAAGSKMPEQSENAAADLMGNIMETIAKNLPKQKSVRFDDGSSISEQAKKLFGGGENRNKKSVHHVLGGGKSADVLLWRNKKISSSVLGVATLVWVFFEWLDYHFLTIVCFVLALGMAVQFAYSTFVAMLNSGSPSSVPRVQLPEELFANVGAAVGAQINRALGFLQDVSCGRDLKQFVIVIAGFFAAAIVGSFCNLLTVIYVGFVCAHTLPVLYERYQDQADDFLYNMLGVVQSQYRRLDTKGILKGGVSKFRKSD
ncbi:unnamed protein product [Miscanthus lutarioriparius]|uniref:Reticulon-like protein n=1 Tax=Miscanthus lutarioriparius TaxID=422564 RepID=A0A811NRW4_9POAL|nr:unnamed protein product [Miscanthus lutarioriparius]